jgi:hypothetical protein
MAQRDTTIGKSDVLPCIKGHQGNKILARAINKWTERELLLGLAQYVHFNSVFGAGVASLSGAIARRQDLFRDSNEEVDILADQSVEVASQIFFSAIDELGRRKTHRSMAKETLRASLRYYNCASESIGIAEATKAAIDDVQQGYSMNGLGTDADLFRSIGFHMSSELLADQEFNIIDQSLQKRHPALVQYLKNQGAYAWIQIHTTVEADHFDATVEAANCALKYYTGSSSKAKLWIMDGFSQFAKLQSVFMTSLADLKVKASRESLRQPMSVFPAGWHSAA